MGELHLEIIVDRLLREFKVDANVGKPQVAYRETIKKKVTARASLFASPAVAVSMVTWFLNSNRRSRVRVLSVRVMHRQQQEPVRVPVPGRGPGSRQVHAWPSAGWKVARTAPGVPGRNSTLAEWATSDRRFRCSVETSDPGSGRAIVVPRSVQVAAAIRNWRLMVKSFLFRHAVMVKGPRAAE